MKLNDAIACANAGFSYFECPDGWKDCQAARAITLALLDPTPVTGEALVAMGWKKIGASYISPCGPPGGRQSQITYWPVPDGDDWALDEEIIVGFQTMGQVRCACLAFGIPIREEA